MRKHVRFMPELLVVGLAWTLAGPAPDESRRRRDHASGIADGKTDSTLSPIDAEHPSVQRQAP